ncbi:MAG: glycosyl transferase [Flavobacterium sp. MedPE-SWcel]|uniref:glycosyltransferase family 2 protein n=1 Tax=uncultured Flavobacterium sp. TaxID=165435 RepID=UPI0009183F33|nr:glycosyltransferase family 2 protein [uncultured Flavobacterium sp.]OIQ17311.1 MAG: glycosyl transferase [Flavobacterium sp. MedPE-SWcel]
MLSILIPTYNYNVLPLVTQLQKQAENLSIVYEIIVFDDASADPIPQHENQKINDLINSRYKILPKNIGRSSIRNLLAKKAAFDWLLFLDADTLPKNDNLLSNYLPHLTGQEKVISGGISYQEKRPDEDKILRWIYGNDREALTAEDRKKQPYLSLLTLNFAVKKSVFTKVQFNETIPNLRHEDTLFSHDLKKENIPIEHIENKVYHLGLDTSLIFIQKSEEAIVGLKYLIDNQLLSHDYIRISKMHYNFQKWGLKPLFVFFHKITQQKFKKNFLSSKPSLFFFDLYRLGYLCSL